MAALGPPGAAEPEGNAAELPPVPREGLSLAALRAFAAAHAGQFFAVRAPGDAAALPVSKLFEALTTAEVVEVAVKPATLRAGPGGDDCTYAELLLAQARAGAACVACARVSRR